jgi:steroid Delta-isomerase
MNHEDALKKLILFFETIEAGKIDQLAKVYTEDVFFKDPFNEVRGLSEVVRIFSHMFEQVDNPRFVVTSHVLQGDQAFLRGATHLRFGSDGKANFHRDYWDAAEELYEKLPLLGSVMRGLKRLARR